MLVWVELFLMQYLFANVVKLLNIFKEKIFYMENIHEIVSTFLHFNSKTNMSAPAKINFVQFTWITILRWCKYGCWKNASSSQIHRQFCEKEPFFFRIHESIIQRPRSKKEMTYLLHQQVLYLLVYDSRKFCFNKP